MTLYLDYLANEVFLIGEDDTIYKVWYEHDFTERKLKNAISKIEKNDPMKRKVELKRR